MITCPVPLIGFAAYSGTGKTTLLTQLIPWLKARGLRIGTIKHAHHNFEIDYPGKDSYELRKAGSEQVLVASGKRWALITERAPEAHACDPELEELLPHLDTDNLDLVLVESFKHAPLPKIELQRPALDKPLLYPQDSHVIAVASDGPLPHPCALPVLDLNDPAGIGQFIVDYFNLSGSRSADERATA